MKILKLNKKIIIICILILLIVPCGIAYASSIYDKAKVIGEQQAEIQNDENNEIVATINGEEVLKKDFESYKISMNQNGKEYSDKELLDKIIERKVLYLEAMNEGITVTDEEVNTAVEIAQDGLKEDEETYEFIKSYIDGFGITEEQYWELIKSIYKKDFAIGKLKNALKEKYIEENNITVTFDDYYDNYKKDLISKADVQTYIK